MQKDKTTKSKAKKKLTPKAQAVQESGKHEIVILDRIAGLTISDIMRRSGYSRQAVRDIINANKDRIDEGIKARNEERQEKIAKALDDDVLELSELLSASTRLMRKMVDRINARLDDDAEKPLKDRDLAALSDVAVKAVDRVHTVVLNQQKESIKK